MACTDALDHDAFKAVDRYCSDGSNRAHVIAPANPHVVWSRDILDAHGVLVGGDGTAFVSGGATTRAISLADEDRWDAVNGDDFGTSFLGPGTFDTTSAFESQRVREAQTTGDALSTSPWPGWGARVAMGEDGAAFVEIITHESIETFFSGVARVTPDGTTQWIEKGDCDPGGGDFPAPHDFVRRGDHLVIVCNTHDDGVEVLEVDANDAPVSKTLVDGSLAGSIASSAEGDLQFFVTFDPSSTASLVTIGRGSTSLGPSLPVASVEAIAADGTIVARTQQGVAAISKNVLAWQQSVGLVNDLFVDSDHTIVVATNGRVLALDLASGSTLWEIAQSDAPLAIASAGPGKIYALSGTQLTLLSD